MGKPSDHYRAKAAAQPNAGWGRLAFYAERRIEAPDTTAHPLAPVRRIKAHRDTTVPTETRGKQSQRVKASRRATTVRAWDRADGAAQRVHDGRELFDAPSLTAAERDHFAGYAANHGPDWRAWPSRIFRHFKRSGRGKGLRIANR